MSPEGRGVFANLSVRENLEMGAYIRKDRKGIDADMERGFRLFPRLKERETQKAGTLSGGEQQMLAMARALMSKPRLLLLDEPSLGLAPLVVHTIFEAIEEIRSEGTTILLVEHDMPMVMAVCGRIVVLNYGRIIAEGTPAQIQNDPEVIRAYLGEGRKRA